MDVVIFGSTGMLGAGVLRECLLDSGIARVVAVVRRPTGRQYPKLREIVRADVTGLASAAHELTGLDACFFTLGASAAGMSEERYTAVTYDLATSIARQLAASNPGMTFIYVSGTGTDSTGRGRAMWARVKGRTENALLAMPFSAAYMFRPAWVQPSHGERSATRWYRVAYALAGWLFPLIKAAAPNAATTTEQFARAMIRVAREGYPRPILEMRDIVSL
jgi:uncharacterized protein YbjT (DUF2867 family)